MTQPPFNPYGAPPAPRDHDRASFSEFVPVGSRKIRLHRSALTYFLIFEAVFIGVLMLLLAIDTAGNQQKDVAVFILITLLATLYLTLTYAMVIYLYARPGRKIWPFLFAYIAIAAIMVVPGQLGFSFIWEGFAYAFRDMIGLDPFALENAGFLKSFGVMFVTAGLCEELFKALPILLGALVAMLARGRPGAIGRFFQIRGPLDGVVMGAFTGAAFVFVEAGFGYNLHAVLDAQASGGNMYQAYSGGLVMLLIRCLSSATGHMALSMLFGYFIGMAVLRRRHAVVLILIGWLLASSLHGLWNAAGPGMVWVYFAVGVTLAILASAVILKARQLHAEASGGDADTMGSIVIDRGATPAPPPWAAVPPQPGAFPPQPAPLPLPTAPPPPAIAEQPLELLIDGIVIPLRDGQAIDLGAEPALDGRGAGIRANIVPHPSRPGVLGLRNAGDTPWTAHLRDGRDQAIDKSQNVRLAAGVRITFCEGLTGEVRPRLT